MGLGNCVRALSGPAIRATQSPRNRLTLYNPNQTVQLAPSSYPQARLMHQWQNRLSEELEIRREIEERNLDPVAAGPFQPD